MRKLIEKHSNCPEHYNKIFLSRMTDENDFDMSQPLRMGNLLKHFHGGRFIEVGCGLAPHCLAAKQKINSEVWGLDWADKVITELRKRYPQINYVVGDVTYLPFRDGYFDYLIAGEVLEHMEDPLATLKEWLRVLKVGGKLAISTPNNDQGNNSPEEHIWSYEEKDIRDLFEKAGGRNCETFIMEETNHTYIIGYVEK